MKVILSLLLSTCLISATFAAEMAGNCTCECCKCTQETHCGCMNMTTEETKNETQVNPLNTAQALAGCGKCSGKGCKCR